MVPSASTISSRLMPMPLSSTVSCRLLGVDRERDARLGIVAEQGRVWRSPRSAASRRRRRRSRSARAGRRPCRNRPSAPSCAAAWRRRPRTRGARFWCRPGSGSGCRWRRSCSYRACSRLSCSCHGGQFRWRFNRSGDGEAGREGQAIGAVRGVRGPRKRVPGVGGGDRRRRGAGSRSLAAGSGFSTADLVRGWPDSGQLYRPG